jgi:hypothetical protein
MPFLHSSNAISEEPDGIDLQKESDRKLFAFCQGAILRQRGLACSPFAGTTDKWILEEFVPTLRFAKTLDDSLDTSTFSAKDIEEVTQENALKWKSSVVQYYQRHDKTTDLLISKLTPPQLRRLPGVYLHVEGLMALCRPQFAQLFEDTSSQDRIRKLVEDTWSKEGSPLHRCLYSLKTREEAPLLELDLRKCSAELDLRIVKLLSEKERHRLVEIISNSLGMSRIVSGAPAY